MYGKRAHTFVMLFGISVALVAGAAHADYQCQLNQTVWPSAETCAANCSAQQWVIDPESEEGGHWDTTMGSCSASVTPVPGNAPPITHGPGGSGNGSPPYPPSNDCHYDVMCPGANSCMCSGINDPQQTP
jgi:hypothetical protein